MNEPETLEQFLERAEDALSIEGFSGASPLHVAAIWGDRNAVELLLASGADIEAKGPGDHTPLYCAVMFDHLEIAKLLLAKGADANARSENNTPKLLANSKGNKEMIALFRKQHA